MGRGSMMPTWIFSPLFFSRGPVAVCACGRCCKHNKEHSTQCNRAAYISYRNYHAFGSNAGHGGHGTGTSSSIAV